MKSMIMLTRLVVIIGALCVLAGCDLIGEKSETKSGIDGKGVGSQENQDKTGDGSSFGWSALKCELVQGKTQWRLGDWSTRDDQETTDPYTISIDSPTGGSESGQWGDYSTNNDGGFEVSNSIVRVKLVALSECKIKSDTKIAYTTKNWLCGGDYIKVSGKDCAIDTIKKMNTVYPQTK
tara:strand:+ start:1141 stop:1677 length:537 start_codon:yes stop_codon:yes gene_type:complete